MANGLWPSTVQAGLAANRPASPSEAPAGTFLFYYATDTKVLSMYDPVAAAWSPLAGGGTFYTVATLPANPVNGQQAIVTDATTPAIGSTVVGAGAVTAQVVYNSTAAHWQVI